MKLTDFDYHLPKELIAQIPVEPRDSSRLLMLEKKSWNMRDAIFRDISEKLTESDVLVVNKTRVINARLKGYITSPSIEGDWGGAAFKQVEIFLHKQISDTSWDCLVYPWKKLKPWTQVYFTHPSNLKNKEDNLKAKIIEISEKWRIVEFNIWGIEFLKIVEKIGNTPLPPYIKERLDDTERYQTVYNEIEWSAAAPTAGLHFTDKLITKLENKWVIIEKVLLHVWLGTFANVETEDIQDHHMHKEYIELEQKTADRLNAYKAEWKRIIAVGTTSIRVLESFSNTDWILTSGNSETDIFIYPGYQWKFVDSLITNFHLPKSTLMMLVSSLAWEENIKKAYSHAIEKQYRFFSFGDAMWIQ
jgi:S-adenosylmethionine:tRNA ribosyltransferase-isomerase